jgi:hypothetical protein
MESESQKTTLSAVEAARLLEQEFARLKSAACTTCKAPTPIWGPGVVSGSDYWYVKMLPLCPHNCARIITKIWAEMTMHYKIERTAKEIGQARDQAGLGKALTGGGRRRRRGDVQP